MQDGRPEERSTGVKPVWYAIAVCGLRRWLAAGTAQKSVELFDAAALETGGKAYGSLLTSSGVLSLLALPGGGLAVGTESDGVALFDAAAVRTERYSWRVPRDLRGEVRLVAHLHYVAYPEAFATRFTLARAPAILISKGEHTITVAPRR